MYVCWTDVAMAAIVLAALDLVQRSVSEVQLLSTVVDGETVRGSNVSPDDGEDIRA